MKLVQKALFGMLIGFAATAAMAGMKEPGKSPGTIAVAVAAEILARRERAAAGAIPDAPPAAA